MYMFSAPTVAVKIIYNNDIKRNEIQENIDEITCIFPNVIFSHIKYDKKCYFTCVKN